MDRSCFTEVLPRTAACVDLSDRINVDLSDRLNVDLSDSRITKCTQFPVRAAMHVSVMKILYKIVTIDLQI